MWSEHKMSDGANPRSPAATEFRVGALQTVIFTEPAGFSTGRVLQRFLPEVASTFDAEPGIPGEALPPEIPRVLLASKSGAWQGQIGPLRCDLIWRGSGSRNSAQVAGVLSEASGWLFKYLDVTGARGLRAAVVLTRFAECELPGLMLARHFCQERWYQQPLNRPQSFELHAHKSYRLGETEVNSWFRAKSGQFEVDGQKAPIVIEEQDINTLPRESPLGQTEASAFFLACPQELDHILSLYFPGTP
jgi:hypothetical protein